MSRFRLEFRGERQVAQSPCGRLVEVEESVINDENLPIYTVLTPRPAVDLHFLQPLKRSPRCRPRYLRFRGLNYQCVKSLGIQDGQGVYEVQEIHESCLVLLVRPKPPIANVLVLCRLPPALLPPPPQDQVNIGTHGHLCQMYPLTVTTTCQDTSTWKVDRFQLQAC